MLPREERFEVMETRMAEKHVRYLQKEGEGVTFLRANIEDDAVQLTYCDPSYIEAKSQGAVYVTEAISKFLKTSHIKKMLIMIVTRAGYYADLNEVYTRRTPRETIQGILPRDIITDLGNIMSIKEDRIMEEEGNHVYSTSETQRRNSNTKKSLEQRQERRIEEL